ncbi:hypothetical protein RYX36_015011, partial [Vicia faba]
ESCCETMTTPYENMRLKRMAENKKKLEALNLLHSLNPLTNHLSLLPNHHRLTWFGREIKINLDSWLG